MKKNKKEKTDHLEKIDFEGDLVSTIAYLQNKMKKYKKDNYIKFNVVKESTYDYDHDYDYYYSLLGIRLETDKEFEERIVDNKRRSKAAKLAAKTRAIKKEERELKQYQKLHTKYKGRIKI